MQEIKFSFCGETEIWSARPHEGYPQFWQIFQNGEYFMEAPFEGEPTERDIVTIRMAAGAGWQHASRFWFDRYKETHDEGD